MKVLANAGSEDTIHLVVVAIVTVLLEWFVCQWHIWCAATAGCSCADAADWEKQQGYTAQQS